MKKITDIDEGTIRRIDWQTLVPPTILFRAFSATFKPTFLFLGAILAAILATWVGFRPFEGAVELNGASLTADRSGGILTVSSFTSRCSRYRMQSMELSNCGKPR